MKQKDTDKLWSILGWYAVIFGVITVAFGFAANQELIKDNDKLIEINWKLVDKANELQRANNNLTIQLMITEKFKMYDPSLRNKTQVITGIAYGDSYYCIWTKNQTVEDINKTIAHEKYHVLIHKDYEHFCGDGVK